MMKILKPLLFTLLSFYVCTIHATPWVIESTNSKTLFTLKHQTVPIVHASFIGWNSGWKWAGTKLQNSSSNSEYSFKGKVKNLGIEFSGLTVPENNSQNWKFNILASKTLPSAIGYGINFKLNLNSPSFLGLASEPELLPNNQGWRWQINPTDTIEFLFSNNFSKVYFERNKKKTIRAFFFGSIREGQHQFEMSLNLLSSNKLVTQKKIIIPSNADRTWIKEQIPWNSSPVDLSFLIESHKPAGIHGFLKADGDKLSFSDGTPIRFWGTNIQASALFKTSDLNIKKQAQRLSRLGFNLVRIHHHDSNWVKPNIFANPNQDTLVLNKNSLKKIDWWIKCLKDEGIYIWLDLQVGRSYTANDEIKYFAEIVKDKSSHSLRGFNYYNETIQQKIMDFNEAYLTHVNPFTDTAYINEPAIVSTLLLNENDLTHHFGNALLPDKKVPEHNIIYSNDVKQASKRLGLNYKKAWRSWEHGDSKIYLNDKEHRYNELMLGHLLKLGAKNTLIPGNTWGGMSLAGLPSLTDGHIIDVHGYGRYDEVSFNPHYRPGLLSWLGAAQVTNKPLSVTEWNVEKFPVSDRFSIPTWLASVASLQGWDSLMLYGYAQYPLNKPGKGHNYSTYNDPALMAMMPASALLYRQNHVHEARHTYHFRLDTFFNKSVTPISSVALRTLVERSKINIDLPYSDYLPWLKKYEHAMNASYSLDDPCHHIVTDPNTDFIPLNQNLVISDTKELSRNWEQGIQSINTDKSQIVVGKIGGKIIKLNEITVALDTPTSAIAVQSMDNASISRSNKILISKAARSTPQKSKFSPFLSEPVNGKLIIHARKGLTLYELTKTGEKTLNVEYSEKGYVIDLNKSLTSPWLLLKM